jgi:hypothetical protein
MNRITLSGKTQPEFLVSARSFVIPLIRISLVLLLALTAAFLPALADAQEFRATIYPALPSLPPRSTPAQSAKPPQTLPVSTLFPSSPPGTYRVEAQAESFQKILRNAVTLQAGDHPVINLALTVGNASQTVSVSAEAPLIDHSNASAT